MHRESVHAVGREPHGSSDDPDLLDFSANTNPEVPDGAREVYESAFDGARTYPEEPPQEYRRALAAFVSCDTGSVVPTPGGLAAIRLSVALAVDGGDTALLPAPSFAEYAREVGLQGGEARFVDEADILAADPSEDALAVVCRPNNPTGRVYDPGALRAFADRCRAAGTTLLVDEAFLGFTDRESMAGREGVVVARSLTKLFGLPGLRVGAAVAAGEDREALLAARRTWNVGAPALAVATHCLDCEGFVEETRERVRRERTRMADRLSERFEVATSEAPFLLVDVGDRRVEEVLGTAREAGIALRDARTFRGLDSHVRVAVRRPAENDRLLEALSDV